MPRTMTNKRKREYLINIISSYLTTNLTMMSFLREQAPNSHAKRVCTKNIKTTQKAIQYLYEIKHLDILEYIYSSFVGNNIMAYSVSPKMVLSPKIKEWDIEEHHQEFVDYVEELRIYEERKAQERQESQLAIQKAKEQGKKVEMVYDKEQKKVVPVILDNENA